MMKPASLAEIGAYIRSHLHQNPTPAEIAAHFGISRFVLSRRFRAETGLSLREYLAALKIEQGIEPLVAGDSIIDSQLEAGHASSGTFSRLFRRHTGFSPREYRRQTAEFTQTLEGELADSRLNAVPYRRFRGKTHRLPYPVEICIENRSPRGVVFVGLYHEPIPRGAPAQGWAVFRGSRLLIREMPAGAYYLLACEIVPAGNPLDYFRLDHCLRALRHEALVFPPEQPETYTLTLRPLQPDDPPITVNLPGLLFEALGYRGKK